MGITPFTPHVAFEGSHPSSRYVVTTATCVDVSKPLTTED